MTKHEISVLHVFGAVLMLLALIDAAIFAIAYAA
jgi:hypothetical protein